MAILYNKGVGRPDNITYLMQKTDEGSTRKTPKEMQALADERNRQLSKMRYVDPNTGKETSGGANSRVVVWPEGKVFNTEDMDSNDNVSIVGDKGSTEKYVQETFPRSSSPINGWSSTGNNDAGIGVDRSPSMGNDVIGRWGAVANTSSYNYGKAMEKYGGINPLQYLAMQMNHEGGHNTGGGRHTTKGIMQPGTEVIGALEKGESLGDLLKSSNNVAFVNNVVEHRQYGDPNRMPVDNYDKNKRLREERERQEKYDAQVDISTRGMVNSLFDIYQYTD